MKKILYVGLDVHKESIDIAIADAQEKETARYYGKIEGTLGALDKVVRKLQSGASVLKFVYEAGPCGYSIYRHLSAKGYECAVVAPSMIPRRSGDRIKTDRRDALNLVRLFRAGELTSIYIPTIEDEAMRDLLRAREDVRHFEKKAKQRLLAFLLRHGITYPGKNWTQAHFRWLAGLKLDHPAQQIVLQEYLDTVQECTGRSNRLTEQIRQLVPHWSREPFVKAYQALRGVSLIVATTVAAEIGDMRRFSNPSEFMAYLGLIPSEHSSGNAIYRGPITKTGNGHVRRVLVEAAWTYKMRARKTTTILKRQQDLPKSVCEISWKAQIRLCARYRGLLAKGKSKQVVITAIARELSAFIWAIDREVQQIAA